MATLELDQVIKRFGSGTVIHGVDLRIEDGEFGVFVGPSGCGKSTLLRMIAGLETVSEGEIRIDGRRVNEIGAADRGLAMVFQSYALYPHMSVRQNMSFGLENIGSPKAEIERRVGDAARMLQIEPLLARTPRQLSGGQRQRVAIGRALVREPKIFLFDEPLSNLDAELRVQMRAEISALHKRLGNTMIYVTHDQVEAMTMADKIVVLRQGKVEQVGRPLDLYNHPANRFVAGFIGSPQMNFLDATITARDGAMAQIAVKDGSAISLPLKSPSGSSGDAVTLGVRPEHIVLSGGLERGLPAVVTAIEQLGSTSMIHCRVADQRIICHCAGQTTVKLDETIHLGFDKADCHLFSKADGEVTLTSA
jgi:multiple sugar transport system ATP-binding protein